MAIAVAVTVIYKVIIMIIIERVSVYYFGIVSNDIGLN